MSAEEQCIYFCPYSPLITVGRITSSLFSDHLIDVGLGFSRARHSNTSCKAGKIVVLLS